jgi:hypothetical protein
MPTEISLSRKVGTDLINIKTDLEPEAAVGLFADLVTLVATANEVGQLPSSEPPPYNSRPNAYAPRGEAATQQADLPLPTQHQQYQQGVQAVQNGLGGEVVYSNAAAARAPGGNLDPRSPSYASGPPPFDGGVPAKVCDHGKMIRFDGVSKKNGQAYVRWDCPAGQKPCVKWGA